MLFATRGQCATVVLHITATTILKLCREKFVHAPDEVTSRADGERTGARGQVRDGPAPSAIFDLITWNPTRSQMTPKIKERSSENEKKDMIKSRFQRDVK